MLTLLICSSCEKATDFAISFSEMKAEDYLNEALDPYFDLECESERYLTLKKTSAKNFTIAERPYAEIIFLSPSQKQSIVKRK